MPTRSRWILACTALLLCSCAQYGRALMEFDSTTGFDQVAVEPENLEFQPYARRWPWLIRQLEGSGIDVGLATLFGIEPGPYELDNPSGFARERVEELPDLAGDDIHRNAEVSRRLLWLGVQDGQVLDQLVTMDAAESILRKLEADPLAIPFAPAASRWQQEWSRREEWIETITRLAPSQRQGGVLDRQAGESYLAAANGLASRPSANAELERRSIYVLDQALRGETDERFVRPMARALVKVIENALTDQLRRSLNSPRAEVRESALLALYRLGGPRVVPFGLYVLARFAVSASDVRYDPDPYFRRTLLQLAAGLPPDWLHATYANGPSPIEYVYDTATRDSEIGMRRVATAALSRCLGRKVSFEPGWADAWWREEVVSGKRDQPGVEPPGPVEDSP